jgi:hypothetical protein
MPPVPPAVEQHGVIHPAIEGPPGAYELHLKILLAIAFLPPGLSFFIGDFRLPLVRIMLMVMIIPAAGRFFARAGTPNSVLMPSDFIVMIAAVWMMIAGMATDGIADGAKGAGALALEFSGGYCVFRWLLEAPGSSVRLIRFSLWVMIVVTGLALLDPLTGHLFTHETVGKLTGHTIYFDPGAESFVRNGLVRAMGPLEHSILFGSVCAWFGILALGTFRFSTFSIFFGLFEIVGSWFSQSRGALAAYIFGIGLIVYNLVLRRIAWRWKLAISCVAFYILVVCCFSRNPIATLMQFGGLDPEAGWYRELIWGAAGPLVLNSPFFGLGLGDDDWTWQSFEGLVGSSVDSLWLRCAMLFGIPGSLLVLLTTISPYWLGAVDRSPYLSAEERNLSVALGIVAAITIFLGFAVHFWGACWILLGIFPAIRAHLAEAAILRARQAVGDPR